MGLKILSITPFIAFLISALLGTTSLGWAGCHPPECLPFHSQQGHSGPGWKDKTLRIRLSGPGTPPVIVVRPGFVTDIEGNFRYRVIELGDHSWRVRVVLGPPVLPDKKIWHILVHPPKKSGREHSLTNIILVGEDGKSLDSFVLKKADPSQPGIFNTRVFASE